MISCVGRFVQKAPSIEGLLIFAAMQLNTVIFDMDGLLIDSEPLWFEASQEVMNRLGHHLDERLYAATMGLRTRECVEWWFTQMDIPASGLVSTEKEVEQVVMQKIMTKGKVLPGIAHIISFFRERSFRIGLASSSAMNIIDVVIDKLQLRDVLQNVCSASQLAHGKPHPQVYLDCAAGLGAQPMECLCFEDSFNGMIAAKAGRMKCVVVPAPAESQHPKFGAADLRLSSLTNFNDLLLHSLQP